MGLEFSKVLSEDEISRLADIAKGIWYEYFPGLISAKQVDYMVEKYQSKNAISRQIASEGYQYFMVIDGSDILGYIGIREENDKLFLSKLYLKKEFRGRGYFSKMLLFIEDIAKNKKLKSLYLTVNKHNDNSVLVYKKKGFSVINEQAADIGGGFIMDDYIMEKKLK